MSLSLVLIILTCAVSLLGFNNERVLNSLLLWPAKMKHGKELYRLLTAGFVHADYMHLAFNMFTFYFFADFLLNAFQQMLGLEKANVAFLALYFVGIIVSCMPSWMKHRNHAQYRSLGASGGVAAIIFAMIYLAPWSKIYLFFAIGIPSVLFAVVYLIYTGTMAKRGKGIVNHDAHLWGAIFGIVFMLVIDPSHGQSFLRALKQVQFF